MFDTPLPILYAPALICSLGRYILAISEKVKVFFNTPLFISILRMLSIEVLSCFMYIKLSPLSTSLLKFGLRAIQ